MKKDINYSPIGQDEIAADIPVRHPNRHPTKNQNIPASNADGDLASRRLQSDNIRKTNPEELLGILHKDLFNYLAGYKADICISILMSTHPAGVEVNEQADLIEFKNALQQAEKTLRQRNTDTATITALLQPGYELLRDDAFWRNQTKGLAVYIADGFFKFLRLSDNVQKELLVNSSFSVSGLVPFMIRKEYFYLLVINKKNAKFYRADQFGIEHIPVDEMPTAVEDVVHFENKEGQKLFRMGGGGKGSANYHGMGSGKPDENQAIAAYLEEIDDTLWKTHLHYSTAPLLLAGLDHYIPAYKSVSDYKHIWPEALLGNHQADDPNTLYTHAMEIMKPYFGQDLQRAMDEYGNKSASALTSNNMRDIIPAAFYGKIARLFVPKDAHIWGNFDEQKNELNLYNEVKDDAENLADRAAAKTIQNGGDVFILEKDKMPGAGELLAIFRY